MLGLPNMFWLVLYGAIVAVSLLGLIFAKGLVAWENGRIITAGKEEPMAEAEIKRTINRERLLFALLLVLSLANVVEYINIIFV